VPPLPPDLVIGKPTDVELDDDGVAVPVDCDVACTAQPGGALVIGDEVIARAKRGSKLRLARGARGRVRVRFSSPVRAAARAARAAGRKPWVSVSVRAKGKARRSVTATRRVKLR
jgi:hypothetical protein